MLILGRNVSVWIGIIASCIIAVVQVLVGNSVISDALAGHITNAIGALVQLFTILAPVIAGAIVHGQVTPTSDPKLDAGTTVTVVQPGDIPNTTAVL